MKAKRTKPYTNKELFTELCARVDLPKILDYTLADKQKNSDSGSVTANRLQKFYRRHSL